MSVGSLKIIKRQVTFKSYAYKHLYVHLLKSYPTYIIFCKVNDLHFYAITYIHF